MIAVVALRYSDKNNKYIISSSNSILIIMYNPKYLLIHVFWIDNILGTIKTFAQKETYRQSYW